MKSKYTIKCKCGAVGHADGHGETQGDGVMTGDIDVIDNIDNDWEGGDLACDHDDFVIIDVDDGCDDMQPDYGSIRDSE